MEKRSVKVTTSRCGSSHNVDLSIVRRSPQLFDFQQKTSTTFSGRWLGFQNTGDANFFTCMTKTSLAGARLLGSKRDSLPQEAQDCVQRHTRRNALSRSRIHDVEVHTKLICQASGDHLNYLTSNRRRTSTTFSGRWLGFDDARDANFFTCMTKTSQRSTPTLSSKKRNGGKCTITSCRMTWLLEVQGSQNRRKPQLQQLLRKLPQTMPLTPASPRRKKTEKNEGRRRPVDQ